MSCLNLKFPPTRKAWKIFTTNILRKLRILQPLKKKSVYLPGCNRVPCCSFLQGSWVQRPRQCKFKRKHRSPVFVDELFRPTLHRVDELFRPTLDAMVLEHGLRVVPAKCRTSRSIKMMERSTDAEAGTSGAFTEGGNSTTGDEDDMWESVAIASPLMRMIDERAEEFISKFRAEMVHQQMAAGDL